MVAYRLTRSVGKYSKGDILLVEHGLIPQKGEMAIIRDGVRMRCVIYSGQPNVVGAVMGRITR